MSTSSPPGRRRSPSKNEAPSLEATLIATVAPLMRHLIAHARRRQAWSELTYQQYNVLRMIDTMGPQGQAEVARRLMVTAPVVTRLAASLADQELVERGADPKDGRAVVLTLTTKGRRRARAMRRDLLEAARELLEPIPEKRRAAIEAALEELQVLVPAHSARR
ncbi:MAG: MarR family transcriptional regulator [Chloroflexi bacterium]|nr:MarR family transcriptional regulator [Chloroflexota bacterium]